jgi:hypothetical protein
VNGKKLQNSRNVSNSHPTFGHRIEENKNILMLITIPRELERAGISHSIKH